MTTSTLRLPRFNGWMLPDDALDTITDLIREHRPNLIVEAGSGRSTVILADMLARIGAGRIVSLEHQPDFALATRNWLAENSLEEFAEVRYAPIDGLWYDPAATRDLEQIDMLLVDGPPGHLSDHARAPALPLLRGQLAPGAVVVLDDTHRQQEQEISGLAWMNTVSAKNISLDKNPLSSGTPAIAALATIASVAVTGIIRRRPESHRMSRVPLS